MSTIEPLLRFAVTGLDNVLNHISRLPEGDDSAAEELLVKAARHASDAKALLETWGSWTGVGS